MPHKISGAPRFDLLQLMKMSIDRTGYNDVVEASVAYIDSKLPPGQRLCGSFTLSSNLKHISERSLKLLSELATSLEEDTAVVVFNEKSKEETNKEGIHNEHEPTGIIDAEEEASQI